MNNRNELARGQSEAYVIADSKPWKAGCGVEADLEQRLGTEGTRWLEEGSETAWWTYGIGVDVYGRDEGSVAGGVKRQEGGRRDKAGTKDNKLNIRKMSEWLDY